MASTSEVGHAKNTANFHDLIAFCQGYGATYNPTKADLKVVNLIILETAANDKLAAVIPLRTEYNDAVNARIQAFDGLKALSTRIVNALQATEATKEKVADAKTFNKKIQGGRPKKQQPRVELTTPVPTTISSSQQSYDQIIQHFAGLISVLESEPSYNPNENDLKVTTLNAKLQSMTQANANISTAYTNVDNKRIERDEVLYNPATGLVKTALDVKMYVKSIFGATSPQYDQISGLQFKIVK